MNEALSRRREAGVPTNNMGAACGSSRAGFPAMTSQKRQPVDLLAKLQQDHAIRRSLLKKLGESLGVVLP
jgi:hypothetical protein